MRKHSVPIEPITAPTAFKKRKPKTIDDFGTDFGFGKEEARQKAAPRAQLDTAYDQWRKDKSPEQTRELLSAANPVIDKALTTYAHGDRTLRAEAKRLALGAFRTYDPARGAKLRTHLLVQLQPLHRAYTQRHAITRVPERIQADRFRLARATDELTAARGREPSDEEMADYTGLSVKRIQHVRKFGHGTIAEGQMRTPEGAPTQPQVQAVSPEDIWVEYVHHDLDPIDKRILEWKIGFRDAPILSNNEIAKRLKITPSAVSQRATKIAHKLEQAEYDSGP